MVLPLSSASLLFSSQASASGGIDTSLLFRSPGQSGAASGTSGPADIASVLVALNNADKNKDKQIAEVAKDPQVQRELAQYAKVVKEAKTLDDVLNDPIARKVLLTAVGLKGDVDNVGLAKKAMASDPSDKNSVAQKMSSINAGWLEFVRTYDLKKYGLDRLSPKMDGLSGRWRVSFEREGKDIEAMLEIKNVSGKWQGQVDGVNVPVKINGDKVEVNMLWKDAKGGIHTTRLAGELGKDGLTGAQYNDAKKIADTWSAKPYFSDAVKEIGDKYIAEKRLDRLDAAMPGLGSAVLFKANAKTFKTALDVLGSPLAREVVTTAFNIPKQIAVQSVESQARTLAARMDPAKLQNDHFIDQIAQRYLITLNGGTGGVTA